MSKKTIIGLFGVLALLALGFGAGLIVYLNSPAFEEQARRYIVAELERQTGGKAGLRVFDLDLWHQRMHLEDLTFRGLEPATAPPLAHFERLDVGLSIRSLFKRHIDLFELRLIKPELHILVSPDGRTNFPTPPQTGERRSFDFEISVDNFEISEGQAFLNERRIEVDFAVSNLNSAISYQTRTGVLSSHVTYDGSFTRTNAVPIPYSLDAMLDYVRGTVLAHQIQIQAKDSELKLQGRINDLLSRNLAGKLEYTGKASIPFLNYFFPKEKLAGTADLAGFLEFSRGYFFTNGTAVSQRIELDGWRATNLKTRYSYHYPERRAAFRDLSTVIASGKANGGISIENLPGRARVILDLEYAGVNAAEFARAYPWGPEYRIFSNVTGTLAGWFEGKLTQYSFSGNASFTPYEPPNIPNIVALPLAGSTGFQMQPGQFQISNGMVQFGSTMITAEGLIHERESNLKLVASSSNLKDLYFIYKDANGIGSFDGVLLGPIKTPRLEGSASLQDYTFQNYKIEHAAGNVRLDTSGEVAELIDITITQGQSSVTISGTTALDGDPVDLRVSTARMLGSDIAQFVKRNIDGRFAGNAHVTSLNPVKAEGDIRADGLTIDGRLVGDVRSQVRYNAPLLELEQLTVRNGEASMSGAVAFNHETRAVSLDARLTSVNLDMFRWAGLPESLKGLVRQANVRADGPQNRPNVQGEAVVENLEFYGEVFPNARIQLRSTDSILNITMETGRNLDLTATIDMARPGYSFTSRAVFVRYPLERIARLSEGTLTVTGNANLSGLLTDRTSLRGQGRIESAQVTIQERTLSASQPFTFDFNPDRLTISSLTFSGGATEVRVAGTVGLSENAPLSFDVSGRVDLALLVAAASPDWTSSGVLSLEGRIGGTIRTPDLRGVARFGNATLARKGIFTTLSSLNGELFFDQNRVTLNNLQGQVGGGAVVVQGTALLRQQRVEQMNIRIESRNVRVRYPEGLRTVVDGTLVLTGNQQSPLLEGNLEIQSMSYGSSFEEFLALIQTTGNDFGQEANPLGRLRLGIHIEGNRNISIQNQIADVEARVDLDIRGSVADPAITGHVEASGGTLLFQGTRYEVTRGNVDFVDPLRIEPIVDIQAEAEVRDYRVILAISGRGDRLRLDLRSDPPLPQLEIVGLVAGIRTREELANQGGGIPTSEEVFQQGAGNILFGLLQSRVGGGRMGLLGLDRVRIDPFYLGAETNDPVARITIAEQVTKDLGITYSQDLSQNRQELIIIEYFVTKDTSILATRNEFGAYSLDVKFRHRFK